MYVCMPMYVCMYVCLYVPMNILHLVELKIINMKSCLVVLLSVNETVISNTKP